MITHCLHHALRIGNLPRKQWQDAIAAITTECTHADCTGPRNCREANAEFLRGQWHRMQYLEGRKKGKRHARS